MIAAAQKNPPQAGGQDEGQNSLSVYSISNKQKAVKSRIIRLRQSWHLEIADFQSFAIFIARLYLEYAPPDVRAQFMGAPSQTPHKTVELAETFLLLYGTAEEQVKITEGQYSLTDLWSAAIQLAGGAE